MTHTIQENLRTILQHIDLARQNSPFIAKETRLLAVTKTRTVEEISFAIDAGQREFAENYLQEALDKIQSLQNQSLIWHFIGPIQSNKTNQIAQSFDWVHTVDRFKIAERLSRQRPANRPPLNALIQINLNQEASKSGIDFEALPDLARAIIQLPRLKLRGLMTIPASYQDTARQHANFARMRQEQAKLGQLLGVQLDHLSMGMSADYSIAIEEGATMVRIGTALFGPR